MLTACLTWQVHVSGVALEALTQLVLQFHHACTQAVLHAAAAAALEDIPRANPPLAPPPKAPSMSSSAAAAGEGAPPAGEGVEVKPLLWVRCSGAHVALVLHEEPPLHVGRCSPPS